MTITFEESMRLNRHLLDDPDLHRLRVREAHASAERLGVVELPTTILETGDAVSLAANQTGFRNQNGRGTCYAFCACAAVEAAYKRIHGLTVDLSEQYAFHVNKAFELYEYLTNPARPYENNSSLWAFQGSADLIDKMSRFAVPSEAAARYLGEDEMQALQAAIPATRSLSTQEELDAFEFDERHVPTAARYAAVYRVKTYRALPPNPTVAQIQTVIRAGYEVAADIPLHCYLIVGFDDRRRAFQVKNSWGENEFVWASYDAPVLGGRYVVDVHPPDAAPQLEAFWIGRWTINIDGRIGSLVVRRFTDFRYDDGQPTKLGTYYVDGQAFDLGGRITDGGLTLDGFIAESTGRVPPGSTSRQHLVVHLSESDPGVAAGVADLHGTRVGVILSRSVMPHEPADGSEPNGWAGVWKLNVDGGTGELDIASSDPILEGSYSANGERYEVAGGVISGQPRELALRVQRAGAVHRNLLLHLHSRQLGVVSGTTTARGRIHGVVGTTNRTFVSPPFPTDPTVVPAFLYAVRPGGELLWYRHDGAEDGSDKWRGHAVVGTGWDQFVAILPGGGDVIYAIDGTGNLRWYEHRGFNDGRGIADPASWAGGHTVGVGWGSFARVFPGSDGVVYAVDGGGQLLWYRHKAVATGESHQLPGAWAGPIEVGRGWGAFRHVFTTGEGVIYAITTEGTLLWYRHVGWAEGHGLETPGAWVGPQEVGRGWDHFSGVFSAGQGIIYGVGLDGVLRWYRHVGYRNGDGVDQPGAWLGQRDVGTGWSDFSAVFALLPRSPAPIH